MGLHGWWASRQQDERERVYVSRAGTWAFVVMSFACVAVSAAYLVEGRLAESWSQLGVLFVGQIVYFALILYWRAAR